MNQGHTGNTAEAAASPAEVVQVLTPNGLEKVEAGQTVDITWRTYGLTPTDYYRDHQPGSGWVSAPFTGGIINNLVYANTNQGLLVVGGNGAQLVNNTVYQEVGEAIRVQGGSANVTLRNNILWVEAGYDVYVAGDSQAGCDSQYNLFHQGSDLNAHVGYWGGAVADLLPDWHAATGRTSLPTTATTRTI